MCGDGLQGARGEVRLPRPGRRVHGRGAVEPGGRRRGALHLHGGDVRGGVELQWRISLLHHVWLLHLVCDGLLIDGILIYRLGEVYRGGLHQTALRLLVQHLRADLRADLRAVVVDDDLWLYW